MGTGLGPCAKEERTRHGAALNTCEAGATDARRDASVLRGQLADERGRRERGDAHAAAQRLELEDVRALLECERAARVTSDALCTADLRRAEEAAEAEAARLLALLVGLVSCCSPRHTSRTPFESRNEVSECVG